MSLFAIDGPVINVLRYDLKLNGNYKAVLRRIRKSEDGQIVVVGSTLSVAELLRQVLMIQNRVKYVNYLLARLFAGSASWNCK